GLGVLLWSWLGVGAVGLPLLGIGIALAGFDRLPRLDMKRAAVLMGGISVLAPYFAAVITGVTQDAMAGEVWDWPVSARLSGIVPALIAAKAAGAVGKIGGLLLGFLGLSGLTLGTLAWHPLQRLEKGTGAGSEEKPAPRIRRASPQPPAEAEELAAEEPVEAAEPVPPRPARTRARKEAAPRQAVASQGEEELPPLELLAEPAAQDAAKDAAQLDRLGELLLEALRTFKVECTIAGRTSGPVVTQFEVVPAPGVKVGRIMALSDDLAIKMRTPSVRVAPIPGRGAVGVEVPNPTARMVTLRELLEAQEWDRSRAVLPIALGRDLEGRPVVTDLAKTPHLLIAGATGSGKSVAVNTIVTALVFRYTPAELRFLMVDPKMVELSMYNALPHMRHRVVTDSRDAATVLKWAVYEMGRRYELLHANGARNIADFNRKVQEGKPLRHPAPPRATLADISAEPADTPPPPEVPDSYTEGILPYIVIVVDELADLMMTVQGEVETPLALLAQKARAIGIHLILATQRPSVNVITGLIKANFPSRIAFRVASKVDSRTILDQNGAEALLGNGDMLFLPPAKSEPMRLQGAFIATEETERLMQWYQERKEARAAAAAIEPDILELVRSQEAEGEETGGPADLSDKDPLFREAAEVCVQNQGGSTSLLQRKLRIGYGRAARIIDQLHYAGILGPPDGSKPREVLIGIDQIEEYSQ
ncbi:MAG TPA: DNA translocase FtsK, partial [Gemmatimonadales bacterium]|nr:DNA translocase FtsK [Gemmatimonadales bacterium]